jgi:hypothetical protein
MKTQLIALLAAATLFTACQRDNKAENANTDNNAENGPATGNNTAVVVPDTIAYHTDARRLAERVTADLNVNQPDVAARIERTYYNRNRRIGELETRYSTDTTGRYTAYREVNDEADNEIRTTLNNPTAYETYTSRRSEYGDGPYSAVPSRVSTTTTTTTTNTRNVRSTSGVRAGSPIKKVEREADGDSKVKYENGAKIKRDDDGSVKIKRADGTKIKIDEDGNRTVKRP